MAPNPNSPGTCSTCFFATQGPRGLLYCCFDTPSWHPTLLTNYSPAMPQVNWPVVQADDWCAHGYDTTTGKWHTPDGKQLTS